MLAPQNRARPGPSETREIHGLDGLLDIFTGYTILFSQYPWIAGDSECEIGQPITQARLMRMS